MFFIVLIASILANIIAYFILEFYLKKIKPMIIKKFTEKAVKSLGKGAVNNYSDWLKFTK